MLIYGARYPAPHPRRVRMYLAEKGLAPPYEDLDIPKREHKAKEMVAKSSLGQVPMLVLDDGAVITESVAICRYFEALHPEPPLFGVTPVEQAVESVIDFARFVGIPLPEDAIALTAWRARMKQRPSCRA